MKRDIESIISDKNIPWERLNGRTVLVTGATGLIGKLLIKTLVKASEDMKLDIGIIAHVRNKNKAEDIFADEISRFRTLEFMVSDICSVDPSGIKADYVIHAAAITDSGAFVNTPVEVIETNISGTSRLLEAALISGVKRFVYLSTMEVYGTPTDDRKITEDMSAGFDVSSPRNSYPLSKVMCESLCLNYYHEKKLPVTVLRLTQTFGPGVIPGDRRVFAQFAQCAMEGQDIILHTKGETKRSYLYTADSVKAILAALLKDEAAGRIYNVANEDSYCSIYEMARMVSEKLTQGRIKVLIQEEDCEARGYAPTLHMNLDTSRIRQELGWKWETSLEDMYRNMIDDMERGF